MGQGPTLRQEGADRPRTARWPRIIEAFYGSVTSEFRISPSSVFSPPAWAPVALTCHVFLKSTELRYLNVQTTGRKISQLTPLSPRSGYSDRKHIWILWPRSIASAQPSAQLLCLCWIKLHLTYITAPQLPKQLVYRTDVSNPRSQVRVTCSVREGLSSIMGTHNCVLSTICTNFSPSVHV
jgi:hypothetical protein